MKVLMQLTLAMTLGWWVLAAPAVAQLDMTGTLGQACFDDGTCAVGHSCNEAGLCEICGGPGQHTCDDGTCDFGWLPIGSGNGAYCVSIANDARFLGNCGTAGFLMCPDRDYCWGASVPLEKTRLCLACGELGERCCDDGRCREPDEFGVCVSGRCVPPAKTNAGPEGAAEEAIEIPMPEALPVPGLDDLPPALRGHTGLRDCACFSTDGRNGTCRENGCVEPENFGGTCIWQCREGPGQGRMVTIRGRDGLRLD